MNLTDGVLKYTLPNGFTVLLKSNHTAPVAAVYLHVKAGYFQEPDKWNGIAHVIEHLMFKGTPRRPAPEQIAREIRDAGGVLNAGTYYEETNYYIVVPSDKLHRALDIQADMIQQSAIDADELARELEVIVQESMMKRDNPAAMLNETLLEMAHDTHRIRRWRIGHPEMLRGFRREDLLGFMAQNYAPNQMILSVVGDINLEETQRWIAELWGSLPPASLAREVSPIEPPRSGFRSARVTADIRQKLLQIHLPAPPELHPDTVPLAVLGSVLSDGRSARLYRRLKEDLQVAQSAWAGYEGFEQMGAISLGAECRTDDPLTVAVELWREAAKLKAEPVQQEELERIKARIAMRRLSAQEEVLGVARSLASYEALGDYRLADTFIEELNAVTPEDVQRVARLYLNLDKATLLEYLPSDLNIPAHLTQTVESALRTVDVSAQASAKFDSSERITAGVVTEASGVGGVLLAEEEPVEIALPHGGTLRFLRRGDLPLVSLQILFPGGRSLETDQRSGIASLLLKSLLKGTASYTAEELANQLEGMGTNLSPQLGMEYLGVSLKSLSEQFASSVDILREVLYAPTLPPDEIEKEKQALFADMRRQQDNPSSLAYDLFAEAYFGASHPYGQPALGRQAVLESASRDDLQQWLAGHLHSGKWVVAIVGNLTTEQALAAAERLIPPSVPEIPTLPTAPLLLDTPMETERAIQRDKKQTAAMMGFDAPTITSDDRAAMIVLNSLTTGMGRRFFRAVRGENALAYTVTSFVRSRMGAGNFVTYTATAPDKEQFARQLLLAEIERLRTEPVSKEEISAAKATLIGEYAIGMQSFGAQSGELAAGFIYGWAMDEPQRYLERIRAVTPAEVQRVAQQYLDTASAVVGVVRGTVSE